MIVSTLSIRLHINQSSNCKGSPSIKRLVVVFANYCLQVNDVGAFGKTSNAGTLCESDLNQRLGQLPGIPSPTPIPGAENQRQSLPLEINLISYVNRLVV